VTAVALVENCGAFICAAQLLGVVADFWAAAFFARVLDDHAGLHVIVVDSLDFGALRAQSRGEGRGLGVRDDRLGGGVFARGAADGAGQGHVLLPSAAVEQVAAVAAEDEGADCRHG
jgi:hypothetical protein